MSLNSVDAKMRIKRSLLSGATPSIGPSSDYTDGTWTATTMVYTGELFYNVPDDRLWIGGLTSATDVCIGNLTTALSDANAGSSGVTTNQFYQTDGNGATPPFDVPGVVMIKQ